MRSSIQAETRHPLERCCNLAQLKLTRLSPEELNKIPSKMARRICMGDEVFRDRLLLIPDAMATRRHPLLTRSIFWCFLDLWIQAEMRHSLERCCNLAQLKLRRLSTGEPKKLPSK